MKYHAYSEIDWKKTEVRFYVQFLANPTGGTDSKERQHIVDFVPFMANSVFIQL